jgi:hypothetical protein
VVLKSVCHREFIKNIDRYLRGEIMKQDEKNQTKKIIVRVHIGGKKKPVTKEAIVCSKSGKIMKFL